MAEAPPFRVGVLGRGTVGGAFAQLLPARADRIERITGLRPGDLGRAVAQQRLVRRDPRAARDLIVELIGGIEPAREYVLRAMRSGPPRRHRQQAAALPARRGAVRGRAIAAACSCASRAPSRASCR